ncbi:MAG: PASTA domain-containing protein [Candidatus Latescibacteria bacterium]|nr:PASTA domain-containing protein [Candidatus Latescibacterota bacterium]
MKSWQFLLLLASLGVACAVGLALSNYLIVPQLIHRRAEVRVPDLREQNLAQARRTAAGAGLEVEVVRSEAHVRQPVGNVVDQHPAPGQPVRKGRSVGLVLSSGPPSGAVPDLGGLNVQQAAATLQRGGFRAGRTLRARGLDGAPSTVVLQYPAAGAERRKGVTVDVVMADQAEAAAFLMPDLKGRTLTAARSAVVESGCILAPLRQARDTRQPPQTVLRQSPEPGTRILRGEIVELVVAIR